MTDTAPPLLLEPRDLEQWRSSGIPLLLVDLGSADNYRAGHIPGALHLPPAALQRGTPPAPGMLPEPEQLAALFSHLGLTPDHHVIAWDDEGGGWAGRLLWTLEAVGHTRYSYLNGGIHAWRGEGLPTEQDIHAPEQQGEFRVHINPAPIAELADILPRLEDDKLAVWDARSAEEYRGEKSGSARAGHIPGAIHLDWLELMDRRNYLRLVDLDVLREKLDALGLCPDRDVVAHCQTHHRSSLAWLVMKILGYPSAKGYHGSWGEWGNREDTPIVAGPEPR